MNQTLQNISSAIKVRIDMLTLKQTEVNFLLKDIERLLEEQTQLLQLPQSPKKEENIQSHPKGTDQRPSILEQFAELMKKDLKADSFFAPKVNYPLECSEFKEQEKTIKDYCLAFWGIAFNSEDDSYYVTYYDDNGVILYRGFVEMYKVLTEDLFMITFEDGIEYVTNKNLFVGLRDVAKSSIDIEEGSSLESFKKDKNFCVFLMDVVTVKKDSVDIFTDMAKVYRISTIGDCILIPVTKEKMFSKEAKRDRLPAKSNTASN